MQLNAFRIAIVFILLGAALLYAQTRPSSAADGIEIARGFKVRPNGVLDIGTMFAEVNYYDAKWTIAQQHDRYEIDAASVPTIAAAAPATFTGTLTTAGGPAKYVETVTPVDGGIDYTATLTSEKELATNEISIAFLLPTKSFAGKEIKVDGQPFMLAVEAAKKGASRLLEKPEVHEIVLPTAAGSITVKGTFRLMIGDDREWNDPRYSMRLYFTPGSGSITQSKIDLQMRLTSN